MALGKQILKSSPWVIPVGVSVLIAAASFAPDEAISNLAKWARKIGISDVPTWLSNPHTGHLVIICGLIFAASYAALVWGIIPYRIKRRARAFEIIFDPKNQGRQFWSLTIIETFSSKVPVIQYRFKIRNKTNRTLREVKATSENIGQMGAPPIRLQFDQTGETTSTLDPGASAFVKWFVVPHPVIRPGVLSGESTVAYGPIRVTVSALDTAAVESTFQFRPLTLGFDAIKEPMIYED